MKNLKHKLINSSIRIFQMKILKTIYKITKTKLISSIKLIIIKIK